jgi:iron complex transport system substrate-binding protein
MQQLVWFTAPASTPSPTPARFPSNRWSSVLRCGPLLLFLLAAMIAAGCRQGNRMDQPPVGAPTGPKKPLRVVSLSPKNTEMMYAIDAQDCLVAVTSFCDYPPSAKELPNIGGFAANAISLEAIVAQKPNLVLSAGSIQQPVTEPLKNMGLEVVDLDAESFGGLFAEIERLGQRVDRSGQALQLMRSMQKRLDRVKAIARTIPQDKRRSVLYRVWNEPLLVAGQKSHLHEMIQICGARNAADSLTESYPRVSLEWVLQANPDVVLVPSDAAHAEQSEPPAWESLRARHEGRFRYLDGDRLSRFGPRSVQALEELAHAVYPEYYPNAP